MAVKDVLDWADEVCLEAIRLKDAGDINMLNRVGSNGGMKLYLDNVHLLKSVKREQFPAYYSVQYKEIARLHEEYQRTEQVNEAVDKVSAMEAKIDKLEALLTAFIESQKPAPVVEPEKPAKGKGKKAIGGPTPDGTYTLKFDANEAAPEDETEEPTDETPEGDEPEA